MSKKSRRLIRKGLAQAKPAPEPVVPAEPERTFWFLPDEPADEVDERDLHDLIKQWRHGRATRSIMDAVQDAYVAIFSAIMIGAMLTNLVVRAQSTMAGCAADACIAARTLVPWAVWFAVLGMALAISRLFGPVLVSRPRASG